MLKNRHDQIDAEIASLLAQPMPPPSEKHLLREKIFALKYEQLGLAGDLTEPVQDQRARDFTLTKVPQNVFSYPMHLREVCMPVRRDFLKEYAARPKTPPTTPEVKAQQMADLMKPWGQMKP